MTMDASNSRDTLMTVLGQHREIWNLERQNLSPQDRERLWNERVSQLNAVLNQDGPITAAVPELSLPPVVSESSSQMPSSAPQQTSGSDSLSVQQAFTGTTTIRKRSDSMRAATERMAADTLASSPTVRKHESEDGGLLDDSYNTGNPPKMQCLPSGRRSIPHIKTQGLIGIKHADAKMSSLNGMGNSLTYSANGSMPSPSLNSPLPSAASGSFSAASSQQQQQNHHHHHHHHHHHQLHGSLPADMSRQNSLTNSFTSRVANMHIKSPAEEAGSLNAHCGQHSTLPDVFEPDQDDVPLGDEVGPSTAPIPIPSRRRATSIRSRRCSGAGSSYKSRVSVPPPTISEQALATDAGSVQPVNQQRLLAPRPSMGSCGSSGSDSHNPHRVGLQTPQDAALKSSSLDPPSVVVCYENGLTTKKVQITKLEAPKKKKESRFFCEQCDKHPGGFRGAHELQRHFDAQHAPVKKAWICVDGSAEGDKLQDCKWCMSQKTYPAYYNAAAHLRRIHFKPKTEGGKKGKTGRGGIGGGKHPPMDELKKYWMRQVELIDGQILDEDEIDEGEGEDDEYLDSEIVMADEINNSHDRDDRSQHNGKVYALATTANDGDTAQQVQSSSFAASDSLVTGSDLAMQAAIKAELALPYLSNTIETMATSFCGEGLADDEGMFSIDPMSASQLLAFHPTASAMAAGGAAAAAAAAAAAGVANEMHQSFCSVDRVSNLEPELSDSMDQLGFDVLFDDNNDFGLPHLPHFDEHIEHFDEF